MFVIKAEIILWPCDTLYAFFKFDAFDIKQIAAANLLLRNVDQSNRCTVSGKECSEIRS